MNPPLLSHTCKLFAFLGTLFLMPGSSIADVIGNVPFTITSSGNYELQSNLTFAGPGFAIAVNASNVVLNLNGFSIINTGNGVSGVISRKPTTLILNGTISGFPEGVVLRGQQSRAVNLQVVRAVFGIQVSASDCTVQDCFIIGTGAVGTGVLVSGAASGVLVKGNQISRFIDGISSSGAGSGSSAFVGNYVADCKSGLLLGPDGFYRENVVTNCTVPFTGGNAIGTENGGN